MIAAASIVRGSGNSRIDPKPLPGSMSALVVALILFPGYFIYHALVAVGMPAMFRGYSVLVAAFALPFLLLAYAKRMTNPDGAGSLDVLVLGFAVALLTLSLLELGAGADATIVSNHIGSVAQWGSLYLAIRLLDFRRPSCAQAMRGSWLVMSGLVLADISEGRFVGAAIEVALDNRDLLASYQDFAVLYLPVALATFAGARTAVARTAVLTVSLVMLFFNGARSEMVAFLIGCSLLSWWMARSRTWALLALLAWVVALAAVAVILIEWLPDNRVVDLLQTGAESSSSERTEMLWQAIDSIAAHPIAGHFASYAPGEYAHNALSAWVDLGALGFAWLCLLLLLPLVDLLRQFNRRCRDPAFAVILALLVLCVLLLASAKFFTYTLTPIALGAYAGDLVRRRASSRRV